MSNSRRRFLGLLGLLGMPSAVWAQASPSAESTMLTCSQDKGTQDYYLRYAQSFDLSDGQLTPVAGDPIVTADLKPSVIAFRAPYEVATIDTPEIDDLMATLSGFDGSKGHFSLPFNDSAAAPSFTVYLRPLPTGRVEVEIARPGASQTLARIDGMVKPSEDDPAVAVIKGDFPVELVPVLGRGAFNLTVFIDGAEAATYQYDYTPVPWKGFLGDTDAYYASARDVTVDADGNANFGNCSASSCFFTTAAVETLGLSDDCWELRSLRSFRDGPMASTESGRALVKLYYAEAPQLVSRINRRKDSARVWLAAYWTHILPCAVLSWLGLKGLTLRHYTALVQHLRMLANL